MESTMTRLLCLVLSHLTFVVCGVAPMDMSTISEEQLRGLLKDNNADCYGCTKEQMIEELIASRNRNNERHEAKENWSGGSDLLIATLVLVGLAVLAYKISPRDTSRAAKRKQRAEDGPVSLKGKVEVERRKKEKAAATLKAHQDKAAEVGKSANAKKAFELKEYRAQQQKEKEALEEKRRQVHLKNQAKENAKQRAAQALIWTDKQEEQYDAALKQHGGWSDRIGDAVEGRTAEECRARFDEQEAAAKAKADAKAKREADALAKAEARAKKEADTKARAEAAVKRKADDLAQAQARIRQADVDAARRAVEQAAGAEAKKVADANAKEAAAAMAQATAESAAAAAESAAADAVAAKAAKAQAKAVAKARRAAEEAEAEAEAMKMRADWWSEEQQLALDSALKEVTADGCASTKERWTKIASLVEGKTMKECVARFKEIRAKMLAPEAPPAPAPAPARAPAPAQPAALFQRGSARKTQNSVSQAGWQGDGVKQWD
jgi:hypothetical protein